MINDSNVFSAMQLFVCMRGLPSVSYHWNRKVTLLNACNGEGAWCPASSYLSAFVQLWQLYCFAFAFEFSSTFDSIMNCIYLRRPLRSSCSQVWQTNNENGQKSIRVALSVTSHQWQSMPDAMMEVTNVIRSIRCVMTSCSTLANYTAIFYPSI